MVMGGGGLTSSMNWFTSSFVRFASGAGSSEAMALAGLRSKSNFYKYVFFGRGATNLIDRPIKGRAGALATHRTTATAYRMIAWGREQHVESQRGAPG